MLEEVEPVSRNLQLIATLAPSGHGSAGIRPATERGLESRCVGRASKSAAEPHAEVEIAVIPTVRTLVESVGSAE